MFKTLKEVWKFREVLLNFVTQELRVRYIKSVLGFFWSLLNPILTMTVTSIVFATIMRFSLRDFAVFVFSGLLPWGFIALSLEGSTASIINAESYIKKIYLPKIIFPLSTVLSNIVNMFFSMTALFIILLFIGENLSFALLFLPVAILLILVVVTGMSLILATATVFFRDIRHLIGILTSVIFYLTPILYPLDYIPKPYSNIIKLNPFYYFIELFRAPIYYGDLPSIKLCLICTLIACVFFVTGLWIFNKYQKDFIYRL